MNNQSITLKAAAAYNILWGSFIIFFPFFIFDRLGMTRPVYPQIWQCVGMIVGVYGIGYWFASFDYKRHWPIVLVGFLGKIFGPIGFAQALYLKTLPLEFGVILVFNDFIWWIPFYKLLEKTWKARSH